MKLLNDINKSTIIICNNSTKKYILSLNKLLPIKIMNLNEFISNYCFSYNDNTIMYLVNKYHYKYDVAKMYLENIYYIEDKFYDIPKLDFLVSLYRELKENDLLIYNDRFKSYVKDKDIIIYDILLDDNTKNKLEGLNYKVVDREFNNYPHDVYSFSTMEDEVRYICLEIVKLIDNGVSPSNIKLTNVGSEYYAVIERIFTLYNLEVNIPYKSKLSSYNIVREFINLYRESSLEEAIEKLDNSDVIYPYLIKEINKYIMYDNKELLIDRLENSYIDSPEYINAIDIVNYNDYVSNDNDYVFMISFNEENIPIKKLDIDYITDNIKEYVYLYSTLDINKINKERTLNIIHDIKNLVITYKKRDYKNSYYPSSLCEYFNVMEKDIDNSLCYSDVDNKMRLVKMYDEYFKYGYKDKYFDYFNNNFKINYNSYKHKYSGINRVQNKLNLSYTKIDLYNKCAFAYYINYILRLGVYEETFALTLGSMVHYVMYKCLSNNDYDIDKYIDEFLGDRILSNKDKFFLGKYKENISELLEQIKLEKEYYSFDKFMYEKEINIDYGNNTNFVGIIDKILYKEDGNNTYVNLIDYKTGNDDISLKYLKFGLNMQLPIYLYLSTKLDFNNIKYTGFYLQKLNIKDKDYRWVGYSNSDPDILSVADNNYENSKIIKGLKTLKDGSFSKLSRVVSNDEINNILDETVNQIDAAISKISSNRFDINPKVIDGINISCRYCKYSDICYKDRSDEVILDTGGDI